MDIVPSDLALTFDWFILALRIAFIALVYVFLYQVARVTIRELVAIGTHTGSSQGVVGTLPAPSAAVEVLDPADASLEPGGYLPLEHYMTVGRRPDNALVIDDSFVSGSHAEIVFDRGVWWLQDLGSTNGTFVNGQPVRGRIQLQHGDVIQFGRVRVRAVL